MTADLLPVLRYPGSKDRIADWIVSHFPQHRIYCEPFCGSLSVFFQKHRSAVEILNDADQRICNLFRVLRDTPEALITDIELTPFSREEFRRANTSAADPVEDARRLLVRCWQSVGSSHGKRSGWKLDLRAHQPAGLLWNRLPERLRAVVGRLRGVILENRDALDLIAARQEPDLLFYLDPPYLDTTRRDSLYVCEMGDAASHLALLAAIRQHPSAIVLSGYDSALYRDHLRGWQRASCQSSALTGKPRREYLWLNPPATAALGRRLPGMEEGRDD